MKVIGFNFNKISVEKKSDKFENMKIHNDISIASVNQIKSQSPFQTKDDILELGFNYDLTYSPDIAKISLSGTMILMVEQKVTKEFMKRWKNKKVPEEYKILIFNVILKKSNLRAVQLEDELNIPIHIPLPTARDSK